MVKNRYINAAVLFQTGKPLQIVDDIIIPSPMHGQLLAKINYAGVCQSQVMEVDGNRGKDQYLPHMLGHEAVGEVVALGDGVSKFNQGDKIVIGWIKGHGINASGFTYKSKSIGEINAGPVTTFSNYSIISENRAYHLPPNTPEHLGFLYGCALPTGAGLVFNELSIRPQSNIVIYGLGGIGLSALLACMSISPRTLIAVDTQPEKLALAKQLGATQSINAKDPNIKEKIFNLTDNIGCDFAIEAAGTVETIERAFSLIKKNGGELIFASHPKAGEKIQLDPFDLIQGKKIRGSWGGASDPDRDIKLLDQLYAKGELPLEQLIGKRYQLADINLALDDIRHRKTTRASITID